ncbi:MAG: redoxin domain-containing protein [Saprospiraceae bacterium]|nr:redoxin domain-containing protein [Saprospiraceae bacterium]
MKLQPGQPAPDFVLINTDKKEVRLSDYRGQNVVVLFFPMAFTGVCTAEMCAMRDDIAAYQQLKAQILAISVDSPYTLNKFKEDQSLNFPLLSDFNKTATPEWGVMYETFGPGLKGVSKRSAFVVDKEGILRYAEVLDNAGELPDFASVRATLASLA